MNDDQRIVFVDESGRPDLKGESENEPYVITGLIASIAQDKQLADIVLKYAGQGSIKSSGIKTEERRLLILSDLKALKVSHYSLVVDKSLLSRSGGLKYLRSGYKFLHKLFYDRLRGPAISMHIVMDTFGGSDFMQGFSPYLQSRQVMFETFEYGIAKDYPGVQLADLVAGSLRLVEIGGTSGAVESALQFNKSVVEYWPPRRANLKANLLPDAAADAELQIIALDLAQRFVEENLDAIDPDARLRASFLRYLLSRFAIDPEEYVYRDVIIRHFLSEYGLKLSRDALSARVIGPLRSTGLLLVSTDKGVKLPYTLSDYREWVERVSTQTLPNLRRLATARNKILLSTTQGVDIVDEIAHAELADVLSKLKV